MRLRFGLLGAGRIGKVHAGAVAATAGAKLVAVADAVPEAAEAIAKSCRRRGAHRRRDHGRQGHRRGPHLHADRHARRPDRAGRPRRQGDLLREADRPLASSASGAASRSCGRDRPPLMIGFNRRFDPQLHGSARRASTPARSARSRWCRSPRAIPAPPPVDYIARSGGIFRDMTIHDFDMARFLLGEEPVAVFAAGLGAGRPGDRRGRRHRQRLASC